MSQSGCKIAKIILGKDTDCPPIDYLDLERAHPPNGSSIPDKGHLGALTSNGIDSGLPPCQEQSYGGGRSSHTAAQLLIATSTAAPGPPALQTTTLYGDSLSLRMVSRSSCPRSSSASESATLAIFLTPYAKISSVNPRPPK